jgi:hypothetical protein
MSHPICTWLLSCEFLLMYDWRCKCPFLFFVFFFLITLRSTLLLFSCYVNSVLVSYSSTIVGDSLQWDGWSIYGGNNGRIYSFHFW